MKRTRLAGAVYVVTFVAGTISLLDRGTVGLTAGLIAAVSYIGVTCLLYGLFKPVHAQLSLVAAIVSFAGIVAAALRIAAISPLVFFAIYCLLVGYLSLDSTFVPRLVGGLMLFAGCGWLTFASPSLARALYPYNLAPGLIGEGSLTIWLLFARSAPVANVSPASASAFSEK